MPDLSSLTTNFFATPNEGFTTTTSGPVDSSSDTVVPFNSVSGLTNGSIFTGLIDPGNAKERAFTGVVDTGGSQITSVKFTTGTNATHTTGATIVDYVTGTHFGAMTKGIGITHEQSGLNKSGVLYPSPVFSGTATGTYTLGGTPTIQSPTFTGAYSGWVTETELPDTITNNGNRSYDLVFNSTDLTDTLSTGMRLRLTRTVSAPTQCAYLESGSSQYFAKASPTGLAQTDDITCMAWIKLESYTGAVQVIMSRANGSTDGWNFYIGTSGQVVLGGARAADDLVSSYQSVPLGKWTHVAVSIDMSGTSGLVYIDGVLVPSLYTNNGNSAFLTPTADFRIGAGTGGTLLFDGKIAQAGLFDAVISASTIRSYMSQGLAGTETNCVGAWSLNGVLTDLDANANTLTASGGALATNVDSPFGNTLGGTLEYGIITKTAFSTNTTLTVQVPEGCTIPTSGGVSAVAYSTSNAYGFPASRDRWTVVYLGRVQVSQSSPVAGTYYNVSNQVVLTSLPIGPWTLTGRSGVYVNRAAGDVNVRLTLSTTTATEEDRRYTDHSEANNQDDWGVTLSPRREVSNTSAQSYFMNVVLVGAGGVVLSLRGDTSALYIEANFNF
jgi:hypothetical protein